MNIRMAGIDYSMAGIDIREKFSFTKSYQKKIYEGLNQYENILGAVIVSTCNRTEIYLSCEDGCEINPFEILCHIVGEELNRYEGLYKIRKGGKLFFHLCKLACGAKSQIWGEDQIISQVKNSLVTARENKGTDNRLEVMFRTAITCAKRIKTQIKFSKAEGTVALNVLSVLGEQGQEGKKVLIIGNGEVGKLVAKTLIENGFDVTMTLRQYKNGQTQLPHGASAFDYSKRYERLHEFDVLISCTLSPHFTIEKGELLKEETHPKVMIDLAVPRDIDLSGAPLKDVILYDIDTIGKDVIKENHMKQMLEIEEVIEKYRSDFIRWGSYSKEKERVKS